MKEKKNTTFTPPVSPLGTSVHMAKEGEKAPASASAKPRTVKSATAKETKKNTSAPVGHDSAKKTVGVGRRQHAKRKRDEQESSPVGSIYQQNGLTEDDVEMIFELGYEGELGKMIGTESLKRLKSERLRRVSAEDQKHYSTSFGYRGEEFVDSQKKDLVIAAYIHDRKKLVLRLLATILLSGILCFIDLPVFADGYLSMINGISPLILPILSMAVFFLTALLSVRQIKAGLRSMFRFHPTPYTVCAILPFPVLLYDLLGLFTSTPMLQVNFLASLIFLLTAVCDVFRLCGELRAFRILSAPGEKHVLTQAPPRKLKVRRGDKIVKVINDDLGEKLYQVRKTNQTAGFFRRFNDLHTASRTFTVWVMFALAAATLIGFADSIITSSLASSLSAFMTALTVCLPVSAVFTFFYPLTRVNRALFKKNCILVGEEAIREYDDRKTVIFADTEMFSTQTNAEIAIQKEHELRRDLYLAAVLFRKLNGTLGTVGQPPLKTKTDPVVKLVRISEQGVEAMIDDQFHLLAGGAQFMNANSIRLPEESTDQQLLRTENVAPLYVAVDGVLKLRYEIEYRINESFEELARAFSECGTAIAINSYDPCINDAFLQACRPDATYEISVIKSGRYDEDKLVEMADTGAVALGKATDILYPVKAVRAVSQTKKFGFRMQAIASLLGACAVLLLTLLGHRDTIGVLPIAGYHLLWIIVSLISTLSELSKAK